MPVCDICNKDIKWEDGYVLTTRQVATSEAYWELSLKGAWSITHKMNPEGDTLAILAQQQANQSSGWLVCESCSTFFVFDKPQAKAHARSQDGNPPGVGPVSTESVAHAAANVWKRLYGSWPSSIQFASSTPTAVSIGGASQQNQKPSSSCFVATAVYCNADCPQVNALREFRDEVLLNLTAGRLFIRIYYCIGPYLAERIVRWPTGRAIVRQVLEVFISMFLRRSRRQKLSYQHMELTD